MNWPSASWSSCSCRKSTGVNFSIVVPASQCERRFAVTLQWNCGNFGIAIIAITYMNAKRRPAGIPAWAEGRLNLCKGWVGDPRWFAHQRQSRVDSGRSRPREPTDQSYSDLCHSWTSEAGIRKDFSSCAAPLTTRQGLSRVSC